MSEEKSAPLLDYLYRHLMRPEFTCRFRWSANAIAFWDNRCVQQLRDQRLPWPAPGHAPRHRQR
jgi:alpha-ketoglutarate-dependent taurine dioxygenase